MKKVLSKKGFERGNFFESEGEMQFENLQLLGANVIEECQDRGAIKTNKLRCIVCQNEGEWIIFNGLSGYDCHI